LETLKLAQQHDVTMIVTLYKACQVTTNRDVT